jgi:hypothetical protein
MTYLRQLDIKIKLTKSKKKYGKCAINQTSWNTKKILVAIVIPNKIYVLKSITKGWSRSLHMDEGGWRG